MDEEILDLQAELKDSEKTAPADITPEVPTLTPALVVAEDKPEDKLEAEPKTKTQDAIKKLTAIGKDIKTVIVDENIVGELQGSKMNTMAILNKYGNPIKNGGAYLGFLSYFCIFFVLHYMSREEYLIMSILLVVGLLCGFIKHGVNGGNIIDFLQGYSQNLTDTYSGGGSRNKRRR